ncbi:MAG: sigma-70 family RNA polymerase sigma factor [Verrucomicrobia bacterium]|nr:sigma-70 family RNA polymerase sigma factor [Verrucomicrobiota bacterium]
MSDVTSILDRVEQGDPRAAEELLPLVYDELRKLAAARMAHEAPGQTLQPTALVHEAWLRLAGSQAQQWNSRGHFFAAAAEAMRRILIETARRKQSQRRGGGLARTELQESQLVLDPPSDEMLAVDEVLEKLAQEDPLAADFVKLRYFVGMTLPEAAEALGIAPRTADRLWAYARSWLRVAIEDGGQR